MVSVVGWEGKERVLFELPLIKSTECDGKDELRLVKVVYEPA